MYLHLGQGVVAPEADIIGIFDLDNTTSSRITRKYLSDAEKAGRVINVSNELPNSFVVCGDGRTVRRKEKASITGQAGFAKSTAGGCEREHERERARPGAKENDSFGTTIYLSQLSSQTLLKRSGTMRFE